MTPKQLTETLTIAVASLCWIGAKEDDLLLLKLKDALSTITRAWKLPEAHLRERLGLINKSQEAIRSRQDGGHDQGPIPAEKLLAPIGLEDILTVLAALKETRSRAGTEKLHELSRLLANYWDLSEEMDSENTCAPCCGCSGLAWTSLTTAPAFQMAGAAFYLLRRNCR